MTNTMIELDLSKDVFHVHAIDGGGQVVLRRSRRRGQMERFFSELLPCVVGMEACGGSHHWARLLSRLAW